MVGAELTVSITGTTGPTATSPTRIVNVPWHSGTGSTKNARLRHRLPGSTGNQPNPPQPTRLCQRQPTHTPRTSTKGVTLCTTAAASTPPHYPTTVLCINKTVAEAEATGEEAAGGTVRTLRSTPPPPSLITTATASTSGSNPPPGSTSGTRGKDQLTEWPPPHWGRGG